jgi:diguanylate cyclase (GGDEF)-like protein
MPRRAGSFLLALLCMAASLAAAQPAPLDARLAEIREIGRFIPEKAVHRLYAIESEARAAAPAAAGEFLTQLSQVERALGRLDQAALHADEAHALGRRHNDKVIIAKALLAKAYIAFSRNQTDLSHSLVWEAEKIAHATLDMNLRVHAAITSGQSHSEDGNFPAALNKLQEAVSLARVENRPIQMVMALNALAILYDQMKEYDKGFETLAEAARIAANTNSPGRMATLKNTEYNLAASTGQTERGLRALLDALALERKIGAESMVAGSLVDLSDSYLKIRDYDRTIGYATQAIAAARKLKDLGSEATAHVNRGQAYLGLGRLAEGKREVEAGLAYYEKSGDKPELQAVLAEYGESLERAGDLSGAVAAYHRERALSDQLFKQRRQKAVLELQAKYETEKKQRQIELLRRENQVKSAEIGNRRLQQRVWWLLALVFAMASAFVALLYRKVRTANAQLTQKNLELKYQSSRDPLTGLFNRRHFQESMRPPPHAERRAHDAGEETAGALFLLDVDHFKHINDTYGHAAGDAVLKMISESLAEILRETDMIVRWGGEEFLAFLPSVAPSGIDEVARRLLAGISAQAVDYQGARISANVSIGYAPFPLASPDGAALPWERVVNLMDMALYLAKAHGRNRAYGVRCFTSSGPAVMQAAEQDLERAWRDGLVEMSIVLGGWPAAQPSPWLAAGGAGASAGRGQEAEAS